MGVLEELETRVDTIERRLDDLTREVMAARLDSWQSRLDQIEVQIRLGSMEARDELEPVVERLQSLWLDARSRLDGTTDMAGGAVSSVWHTVEQTLDELRKGVDRVRATLRTAGTVATNVATNVAPGGLPGIPGAPGIRPAPPTGG